MADLLAEPRAAEDGTYAPVSELSREQVELSTACEAQTDGQELPQTSTEGTSRVETTEVKDIAACAASAIPATAALATLTKAPSLFPGSPSGVDGLAPFDLDEPPPASPALARFWSAPASSSPSCLLSVKRQLYFRHRQAGR